MKLSTFTIISVLSDTAFCDGLYGCMVEIGDVNPFTGKSKVSGNMVEVVEGI